MIDFVGHRKIFFSISGGLILLIFLLSFVLGVDLDISFKGGSIVTYSASGEVDQNKVETTIEDAIGEQVSIQASKDIKTGRENIVVTLSSTEALSTEQQADMTAAMVKAFPSDSIKMESTTNVQPSMGMVFLLKCVIAIVLASILMLLYIAFRFRKVGGMSAGAMTVVALLHDVLMVYGAFVVFRFPLDSNFVAAVLTILGYSINNTIVIYDRVRENEKLYGKSMGDYELINKSVNQSLTRTINTTAATLIALTVVSVVAVIFNVKSILTFTLPLMVGMLAGVFSSVCLVTPLWYTWRSHKAKVREQARGAVKSSGKKKK